MGDTLVVNTTGFRRETTFMGGRTTPELRVTERFSFFSPDVLLYRATGRRSGHVDPTLDVPSWR